MKKLFIICLLTCLFSNLVYSQDLTFRGRVIDSTKTSVQFANVMAIKQSDQSIGAFAVTDDNGEFKLILQEGLAYTLKISFVGFTTFEQKFIAKKEHSSNVLIELKQSNDLLNEVQVLHEMPVIMSGDTLVYKTEAFTNGKERKLGDVLTKLPGIEVDDNGGVTVQGKKVNKLLVDGKQFFDGDTKMGVQNIPANAIDKVQVLRDYNEVGPMEGLQGEDNLALNIKLKEGKKNIVFGDATLGGGLEDRFLGHLNSFFYSKKLNVNLIADANNIGEVPFTRQDYYRFSGGINQLGGESGTLMSLGEQGDQLPTANRENAFQLRANLGALNFNYTPSKKWSHNGFMIGSENDNTFGSFQMRNYLQQDSANVERLNSIEEDLSQTALLKYSSTYVPNQHTYFKYSAFGKILNSESIVDLLSIRADTNNLQNFSYNKSFNINQQLSAFHSQNEQNVFSFEGDFSLQRRRPSLKLNSNNNPFDNLLPLLATNEYSLVQNQSIRENQFNAEFNYYRILNLKNHINLSLGASSNIQSLSSEIEQITRENNEGNLNSQEFNNSISRDVSDLYIGMQAKSKFGALVFSPGLFVHNYKVSQQQYEITKQTDFYQLVPRFKLKWQISTPMSFTLDYDQSIKFANVEQLSNSYRITDYNSLFIGNSSLKNAIYHNMSAYYNYFNLFSGMNIFGNVSYLIKKNDFGNSLSFEGSGRSNSLVNLAQPTEQLSSYFMLDKKFKTFKVKGTASINGFRNQSIINETANNNQSISQDYNASLTTTFFKQLDVTLGYGHQFNDYKSNQIRNSFTSKKPKIEMNWTMFKFFNLITDFTYNAYLNKETNTESIYKIWNAQLNFRKPSTAWEFKLAAYNLLDTRGIRRDSFNESLINTYEYFIQKRYVVFSVKYDL